MSIEGGDVMRGRLKELIIVSFLILLAEGAALAQNAAGTAETRDRFSAEVISELRRTRRVIEQLQGELNQLQVAAIRIRAQTDLVISKEARLDAVRAQAQLLDDVIGEARE